MQENIDEQPSPQPKVKVGDWVEYSSGSRIHQVHITKIDGDKCYYKALDGHKSHIYKSIILRILPRSEVKVSITLEGTVEKVVDGENEFRLRYGDGLYEYSYIDLAHLTPADAELVRELTGDRK